MNTWSYVLNKKVSEFRTPVPWGEVRGRDWGPKDGRPVLCIHGWADNAGTFNTLIPLLPQDWRFVAVDLPGHGLSSPRPPGVFYTFPSYVADVRRIVQALQWERFTIIGHSMGANVATVFSALFPEMVEAVVLLDSYGSMPTESKNLVKNLRNGVEEMIEYERNGNGKKEKIYTREKALERLMAANPVLTEHSAQNLLERGSIEVEGGLVFSRDFRINLTNISRFSLEQSVAIFSQIQARVLIVLAENGLYKTYSIPEGYAEALEKGFENTRQFKEVTVSGDHHVHLNNPENVAPVIIEFLQSVGPEEPGNATAKL
ncbi:serine hydrolase-like protein isoform X2 [Denticeps clupeoides]|uniref:serine hydrolase-like protein isoform X2 n=1 Tax=Denticeps clupeoides TaxID=299321 RepID=UPI0010A4E428|nr:serine hydrolase-like protein 2 isoform X2 [Denticeps clupeoides]